MIGMWSQEEIDRLIELRNNYDWKKSIKILNDEFYMNRTIGSASNRLRKYRMKNSKGTPYALKNIINFIENNYD